MTKSERKKFIKMAEDFCYSDEIISKLENAKTEFECEKIMHDARQEN